jgi:hypothetical protein
MDQEFKIIITGDASSGIAAARQAGDATKKLKVDTSDLSDEWKRANGVLPPLEENLKKNGKAAEESGLSHRELRRVLSDIGNVAAPGAGRALGELAFGPVGAALALVSAFEMLRKKLDEVDKEFENLNAEQLEEHRKSVEEVWTAWDTAKQELLKYDEAVKQAGKEKDGSAERLKMIQTISAAQTEANLKEFDERQKVYLLVLKTRGASAEQIAAAKEQGRAARDQIVESAANRSLDNIQADIDRRKDRQSDFDSTAAAEQNRVARADVALDQANDAKAKATDPKAAAAAQAAVDKALAELDKWKAINKADRVPVEHDLEHQRIAQANYDTAAATVARQKSAEDAANKAISAATAEKNAAEEALHRVTEAGTSNASTITRESREVETGRAVEAIKESSDKNLEAIKSFGDAVELMKGKDANQVIASGSSAMDDLQRLRQQGFSAQKIQADYTKAQVDSQIPGAFSEQDQQAIARYQEFAADKQQIMVLNALLTTLGDNAKQMVAIIREHQKGTLSQGDEIARLQATNASIQAQQAAIQAQQAAMPHQQY